MIQLSCFNCGRLMTSGATRNPHIRRVDASSVDIDCSRCKAIYRVSITMLHEGDTVDHAKMLAEYAHTYDTNGDRAPLCPKSTTAPMTIPTTKPTTTP